MTRLYQKRKRNVLAEMLPDHCGRLDTHFSQACSLEAKLHEQIWEEEHRTLPVAERITTILNHLELSVTEPMLAKIVTQFEENILDHPPIIIDGARDALQQLAGRYRLGIISDVGFSPGRVLKRVLADNDLLDIFDSLVFSDEAGRAKPHKDLFHLTARSLSAGPDEMVHVGDLERTDIQGARQAGYRAIRFTGITRMKEDEETIADFVTDRLTDIPGLVQMLS